MSVATKLIVLVLALVGFIAPQNVSADSTTYKALQKQSNTLFKAGKVKQSLALAQKLLLMARKEYGDQHIETAMQHFGIGLMLIKLNRASKAVPHYEKHLAIKEKLYGVKAIGLQFPLNHLAGLYKQLGKLDLAQKHYARVKTIQEAIVGRNTRFTARAHGNLASVNLKRGKWNKALAGYRHSARLYTREIKKGGALRIAAIDEINEQQISKNKDVFAGLTRSLWELQALDKKPRSSANDRRVSEALDAAQWAWRTTTGNALGNMAARFGAGDSELAKRIRSLQEISQQITALNEQDREILTAIGNAQREAPGWARLNRIFWNQQNKLGPPIRSLAARIRKLKFASDRLQKKTASAKTDTQRQKLQVADRLLNGQIKELRNQLSALQLQLGKAVKPVDEINARIEHQYGFDQKREIVLKQRRLLTNSATKMNGNIIKQFPGYVELIDPQPLKITEIKNLLARDEALLVYLIGKERSFVFAINKDKSSWAQIKMGASELDRIVAELRVGLDPTGKLRPTRGFALESRGRLDKISTAQGEGLPFDLQVSHNLYKKLISPVADILASAKHVMVVPAGALTSLPFQVLVTQKPEQALPDYEGYRKASWLIRRHALSVLPSVSSLRALRRFAPKGRAPKPFIGYGDPILDGAATGEQRSASVSGFFADGLADISEVRKLSPLPDTARELNTIAARLGVPSSHINLRERATETAVKRAMLFDYRLIHFATHGLLAGDLKGLAEPALVLTPPAKASAFDDGLLTASEAAQLKLRADWVVMSACNTASGGKPGAEALSGLARAFFYAGARALLVSHWPVFSNAATELTTKAFAELKSNPEFGRAQALQRSMLALIENRDSPGNAHPSVWAPFIVVGEGGRAN